MIELHVVKDEELGFRAKDGRIGQAGAGKVFFCPLGDPTGIAIVGLLGARFGNGTGQRQGGHGAEGVDKGSGRVRHGQHVTGFNAFPASDTGAVKAQAVAEGLFVEFADGATEMLPGAKGIDEFDVHHLGPFLARHLQDAAGGRRFGCGCCTH